MNEIVSLSDEQINKHQEILLNLFDIRGSLMLLDPDSLTLEQHIAWNEQMFQVGLAIIAGERAVLTSISEDYAKILPDLKKSTDDLERDLHKLKGASEVISAVGSALGTISSVVTLLG